MPPKPKVERALEIPEPSLQVLIEHFAETIDPDSIQLVFAIRALARRIDDRISEWLARFGLTASQFNYLANIYAAQERGLTLNELSRFIHSSNASVGTMVALLERQGLVELLPNPKDRRSRVVRVTPPGRRLFRRAFVVEHQYVKDAVRALARSQREQLSSLIGTLGTGFTAQAAAAHAPRAKRNRLIRRM